MEEETQKQLAVKEPDTQKSETPKPGSKMLGVIVEEVQQAGQLITTIAKPQALTKEAAFVNYVRDSLLVICPVKFKRAKRGINNILSKLMEEDDEDDAELQPVKMQQSRLPSPVQSQQWF